MPLKVQQDEQPQLNLTPMIDVLFLLIIFFMVATTFGDLERNMELQVPEVAEAGDSVRPAKPLVINVFADGHARSRRPTGDARGAYCAIGRGAGSESVSRRS